MRAIQIGEKEIITVLAGKVYKVAELSVSQTEAMYSIMKDYYDNITEENFYGDLNKKVEVILLCDESGMIQGFTTLAVFSHGEHVQLLFSGDTIVRKEFWGDHDLLTIWVKNAMRHAKGFDGKTYWLLLTKGYKTYKFLHTFFNTFYPCIDAETPWEIQEIIDGFANEQFGDRYQYGVYAEGKDYLKREYDDMNDIKMKNKHTAFFFMKNPDYQKGDELVCIAELSLENLNRVGQKVYGGDF